MTCACPSQPWCVPHSHIQNDDLPVICSSHDHALAAIDQDRLDGAALRLLKEAWPDDWVKVAVDLTFEPGHVALAIWPLDNHPRSGIPMRRARTLAEAADAVREALAR